MSNEASLEQKLSTTTLSSVAVQAGNASIVIAVLKPVMVYLLQCGKWVKLQLAESTPNLLEIGSNQDETKKLLQDHELLLTKLKALEDQVWNLLHEADKAAEENKEKSQVYDAMAETLGDAWDALVIMLKKRQALLELTTVFFENALEFAVKIDQVEDFVKNAQEFDDIDNLRELLLQQEHHTKELLEKSLALLNKSHELTEFIEEFKREGPNANPKLIQGAQSSCLKIDNLLELLQDRRRQLDRSLKHQRRGLEQVLQICLWHQQENRVTSWYKKNIRDYLQKENLGSSLLENEELLQKHKEMEVKVKEWNFTVEQLEAEALKILLSEDYTEKEHLNISNQKIHLLRGEVCCHMEERKALLQEANDFFNTANKAVNALENYLKIFNSEGLSLPILSMKYEELKEEIKGCTASTLQKGQTLINKADSHSSWAIGIQRAIENVKKKEDQLIRQCPDDKELMLKKQQWTVTLEDHLTKVLQSIKKITSRLAVDVEVGSHLSESERILNEHLELANQIKETSCELGEAEGIIKDMKEFEPEQVAAFKTKTDFLNEELKKAERNICTKIEILTTYVAFLKSSLEVNDYIQNLKEFYQAEPLQTSRKAENKNAMESVNGKWQESIEKFFSTENLGRVFLNLVNTISDGLIVKVEKSVQVIEETIINLSKEMKELTDLWAIWNFKIHQGKPVRQQCWILEEQLNKTTHGLRFLQEALTLTSTVDLGSYVCLALEQQKLNQMKPQFQQMNAELEYLMKLLELPSQKGFPVKENSERISELIHLHQMVKSTMTEYDEIFNKTLKFHHVKKELECLSKSGELDFPEIAVVPEDVHHAKAYLLNAQKKHMHIRQLYKLAIDQGVDILSAVQKPNCLNVSAKNLKQELARLECDSISWSSKADKYEEELSQHFQYYISQEEINELRESFKDLKKKFNNMKFNYIKKTEKARNLKALKIQIQQVDTYAEKIQILKKKIDNLEKKLVDAATNEHNVRVMLVSISELQKQLNDFGRVVEDYKQNLGLTERLQLMMEECQFCFEDVSATVIRVGKYSAECKTREAVETLYKQFNKFIESTVPQQEEKFQQIIDLAEQLYGFEEGNKYVEKTVSKYKEILNSVDELCRSLREFREIQKDDFAGELVTAQKKGNRQEECEDKADEEKHQERNKLADIPIICPAGEDLVSQDTELSSSAKEDSLQTEFLAEEIPSGDEYEYATRSCQRQMVIREEIKSTSEKNSMACLTGQAPNFSQLLSNVSVVEGSPVTLEVEVTGIPEPTLTWYKKGQKVTADEHLKLSQKETKHTLFIQKVCDNDAGLYVARAKNSSGTISSSAILRVQVQGKQPNFIQKFGHTTLQEGEDLILHCIVRGKPIPHVYWSKDDIQIVAGDISTEKLGDNYYLLKRNVALADTGKYICVASNEVGKACCSAIVTVIEKNKNPELFTVSQAKSEWENRYFSTKGEVTTAELVQDQDMYCVRGQMPVLRHLPVRFEEKLWLQGVYLELVRPPDISFSLENVPGLLQPTAKDQKMNCD
ncbi:coiled-coil domain-containing protein 141 isoform X6 [Tympanuchus pallidicinctus]|uniref:coiled-coil domain-containing protein 141 isoform X6 n=1 Tax=Tympanuchus pallidicinctus TaxID=109042 RepID=UPI002286FEFF|nr:coiled-coil domain-containing protein 141 isoform X6 [Tympanuchus pallidicinctus]